LRGASFSRIFRPIAFALLATANCAQAYAQQTQPHAKESSPAPTEKNAAQIELLETKVRFETNGDSRKEVHARVRINNELGARQFARLNFDFNRSFQTVEIPLVCITHPSGGVADILPSAITDNPNPAVVDYPAYHDVRVKSVRILGLAPDDLLEYRVITITTHHPLAPDFWLDHTFDRSGVVSEEIFELDLPEPHLRIRVNPHIPSVNEKSGEGDSARVSYKWAVNPAHLAAQDKVESDRPDVALTTFASWSALSSRISRLEMPGFAFTNLIYQKAEERGPIAHSTRSPRMLYDIVSRTVRTIDLPFDSVAQIRRGPEQILDSNFGTVEEKVRLLDVLLTETTTKSRLVMYGSSGLENDLPRPNLLLGVLLAVSVGDATYFLDPALEVAPFGAVPAEFRGRKALQLAGKCEDGKDCFVSITNELPFPSKQAVNIKASLRNEETLKAIVNYSLRGDNELLLRVAFHQTPKEKWKDVAQMLALSDGFRGQITNVTASDPYDTDKPFEVEYEISQPKFVDWSKKTVRIPAILPLPGLPDPPTAEQLKSGKPIDLGTPLTIDLEASIELPAGAIAQAPIGTTVTRDYATFSSKYSVEGNILHASRSYHFLSSELPASRANDLNAFLHAVQSDQTQLFTVTPAPQK